MTDILTAFDHQHVVDALTHLNEPGALMELRHPASGGDTMRGHFSDNPRRIADIAASLDGKVNVYTTFNRINPELAVLGENSAETTKNIDVENRNWFFIDMDPKREKDTASTTEQFDAARATGKNCVAELRAKGWPEPTVAYSGNGIHLLWPCRFENNPDVSRLFQEATAAVAQRWDNDIIKVDKAVHNAARIMKLYGTKSTKGTPDDPDKPQRYSQLMVAPVRGALVTEEQMRQMIVAWGKPVRVNKGELLGALDPDSAGKRGPGRPKKDGTNNQTAAFDMAGWLSRMGVSVREVVQEATRKMFILNHCVFDPGHVEKDSAVFLGEDGMRGYHCFHDSCADKTWSDVRSLFDTAYADRRAITYGDLPMLQTNERRQIDIVSEIVCLMVGSNDPPTLFRSEGQLLSLNDDTHKLVPLNLETFTLEAVQRMSFVHRKVTKDGVKWIAAWPEAALLKTVMVSKEWKALPECNMVSQVPLVGRDGTIHSEKGYNLATKAFLVTDKYAFRRDPATVTRTEALAAKDWLMEWPLEGFPFVDSASRTHALAAMLQHCVTPVIAANTPLYLVDASRPGSGKGLLGEVIARAAGTFPRILALPVREEERQKTIVSTLLQRPTHVIWDNVRGQVDSPALEALLTAPVYSARLLGASANVDLPATNTCWMLTANNATFSPDLVTRSAYIRLEPQCEDPTQRSDFKINNLSLWLEAHDVELVEKVMTIVAYWVGQGMPKYSGSRRHRLSRWREVLGGILGCVDMEMHFLANTDELREAADTDTPAWEQFVADWLDRHRNKAVQAKDLMDAAFGEIQDPIRPTRSGGPMDAITGAATESLRIARLGIAIKAKHGAIFSGNRITVKRHARLGNFVSLEGVRGCSSLGERIEGTDLGTGTSARPERPLPPAKEAPNDAAMG